MYRMPKWRDSHEYDKRKRDEDSRRKAEEVLQKQRQHVASSQPRIPGQSARPQHPGMLSRPHSAQSTPGGLAPHTASMHSQRKHGQPLPSSHLGGSGQQRQREVLSQVSKTGFIKSKK